MDYLNTIYIEWIYPGVELHNLMNISNPSTFRVETFQLSLSMKSQLNVNSSGPRRFDSKRTIMFYKTFICFYVSEAKPLCFSFCSQRLMMLNDVEYATFKIIVTQMSNYIFVISFQLMFYNTLRYRLARALCIFNFSFN